VLEDFEAEFKLGVITARKVYGEQSVEYVLALTDLIEFYLLRDDMEMTGRSYTQAVTILTRVDPRDAPGLLGVVHEKLSRVWGINCVVRGKFAEAEDWFRDNLRLPGSGEDESRLEVLSKLVVALRAQGKNAEALATHLRVLSAQQRQLELVREFGSDPVME